jgi:NAD(P)H-flavin reductase/cytochrome b involved in lipid metabolism
VGALPRRVLALLMLHVRVWHPAQRVPWSAVVMTSTNQSTAPSESMTEVVPRCDPTFDEGCTGAATMTIQRLVVVAGTGASAQNPRMSYNDQTHFLDASVVYGANADRCRKLRTFSGGLLKADSVNGVPENTGAVPMAGPFNNHAAQRLAGDARANVNPGILALHGLFVLEHNRWAAELKTSNPGWDDERLFQEARKRVMAIIQSITFNEYAPLLLGEALPEYAGYQPTKDPTIDLAFAIAAYRYGHSGINNMYLCIRDDGTPCPAGHLLLRDAYFRPSYLKHMTIADLLRGGIMQPESAIDTTMVDDVRNFLEGIRKDLAAVDILRGRDVGLPSYSRTRVLYGLSEPHSFADVTSDAEVASALSTLYGGDVSKVDLWVGGLAERSSGAAFVGETFRAIIREQFIRTRDADRFYFGNDQLGWYEDGRFVPYLTEAERKAISATKLSDVIKRNTGAKGIPDTVFRVPATWPTAVTSSETGGGGSTSSSPAKRSQQLSPALKLEWTPPQGGSDTIEMTLTLEGTGWAAIGLGKGMANADVIMVKVVGGQGQVIDAKASGYALPAPDSSQDVQLVSASETGGRTVVTFKRKINTGDSNDVPLVAGGNDVIAAWDPSSDTFAAHGSNRVRGLVIDFLSASSNGSTAGLTSDLDAELRLAKVYAYAFHGLSMFAVWGILVPIGVITVRFLKHLPAWGAFHRWVMMLAATITIPAAGSAIVATTSGQAIAHQYIGSTVAIVVVLEIVAGSIVQHWLKGESMPPKQFFPLKVVHRIFGWLLMGLGMTNCFLGVGELLPEIRYYVLGYLITLIVVFVALGIYDDLNRGRLSSPSLIKTMAAGGLERAHLASSQQSLTMKDVKRAIRTGNKWVILDGWVFDVTQFLPNHPGGAYLLESAVGSDIGQWFFGREAFSRQVGRHSHSQRAHNILRGMCVGVLQSAAKSLDSSDWADQTGGDSIRDEELWQVDRRVIVNPGAKREVVKLHLINDKAVGTLAVTWRPSTLGRYMLVRFKTSDDGKRQVSDKSGSLTKKRRRRNSLAEMVAPSELVHPYVERPYTIVRSDNARGFSLYVRKYPDGEVSPLVHDLRVGDSVTMLGPMGVGIHLDDDSGGTVVAIAQGTGVFSYFEVITHLVARFRAREGESVAAASVYSKGTRVLSGARSPLSQSKTAYMSPAYRGRPLERVKSPQSECLSPVGGSKVSDNSLLEEGSLRRVDESESDSDDKVVVAAQSRSARFDTKVVSTLGAEHDPIMASLLSPGKGQLESKSAGTTSHWLIAYPDDDMQLGSEALDDVTVGARDSKRCKCPLRLVLVCCFEDEDNLLECDWLKECADECPFFDLHINVARDNHGGRVVEKYGNSSVGYLADAKLSSVLPSRDLLFVSICGNPTFVRQIQEQYLRLGLPRNMISVV